MSLRPSRRVRPFTSTHTPNPYDTEAPAPALPASALAGRVLESRACGKCGYDLLGLPLDGKCPECGTAISTPTRPSPASAATVHRGAVRSDKKCTGCGYNLRGLPVKNLCPECGKPIITSVRAPKYGQCITAAPLPWLKSFALACVLFAVGGLGLLTAMLAWAVLGGEIGGVATIAAGLIWSAGVLLITRPRPPLPGVEIDPRREWMWSRLLARISQPFWIISGVIMLIAARSTLPATTILPWAILAATIRGFGLAAVFVYVSNLANWAGDDSALQRTRASIVLGPFAVFWGVVSILNGWAGFFLVPGPPMLWGAMMYGVLILLPMCYLGATMWAVGQMGPWALTNHIHEQERLERMQGRAAAELAAADQVRSHHILNDTSQPEAALMPGPASRPTGPAKPGESIRPGNRRVPPKLGR